MKSPVEKLSNALSPMSITEDSMSLSQRLTVKTDTLELVRKMNKQLQHNNVREILTMDIMQKTCSLSQLETELLMQNDSENVRQRLKFLTDYFTYLSAKDLD